MTASPKPNSTVLLFYDGYERRAEPRLTGRLKAVIRRHARFVVRTLRRQQARTGFYTWFFMLRRALERAGMEVRVNDFEFARRHPHLPIGAAGYARVIGQLDSLPNPRLVGPGLYATPLENPKLFEDPRNVFFLQTCDWAEEMFRPWFGDRMRRWFGGYDMSQFEDVGQTPKTWDVLVYDKIYFDRDALYQQTIEPFLKRLDQLGLTYTVIRYGAYHQADYIAKVRASRCMAFFAHSETQGMAYQECLAMNVPIFAWDEGIWPHPAVKELNIGPVTCASVPYFDDRCGVRFKIANMMDSWDQFRARMKGFQPRRFVAEEMTLQKSADAYLKAYRETAEVGARLQSEPARAPVSPLPVSRPELVRT